MIPLFFFFPDVLIPLMIFGTQNGALIIKLQEAAILDITDQACGLFTPSEVCVVYLSSFLMDCKLISLGRYC